MCEQKVLTVTIGFTPDELGKTDCDVIDKPRLANAEVGTHSISNVEAVRPPHATTRVHNTGCWLDAHLAPSGSGR